MLFQREGQQAEAFPALAPNMKEPKELFHICLFIYLGPLGLLRTRWQKLRRAE